MANCVRNICAKNRQNPLILFKVTTDNVGAPFLSYSQFCVKISKVSLPWQQVAHDK